MPCPSVYGPVHVRENAALFTSRYAATPSSFAFFLLPLARATQCAADTICRVESPRSPGIEGKDAMKAEYMHSYHTAAYRQVAWHAQNV